MSRPVPPGRSSLGPPVMNPWALMSWGWSTRCHPGRGQWSSTPLAAGAAGRALGEPQHRRPLGLFSDPGDSARRKAPPGFRRSPQREDPLLEAAVRTAAGRGRCHRPRDPGTPCEPVVHLERSLRQLDAHFGEPEVVGAADRVRTRTSSSSSSDRLAATEALTTTLPVKAARPHERRVRMTLMPRLPSLTGQRCRHCGRPTWRPGGAPSASTMV